MGKVFNYRFIEFFVFDYDSLPNLLSVGITFPLAALDKIRKLAVLLHKVLELYVQLVLGTLLARLIFKIKFIDMKTPLFIYKSSILYCRGEP